MFFKIKKFIFTLIFFNLLFISSGFAWSGKVVRIIDGDTFIVLKNQKKQIRVRLYGIDTSEKKQVFGQKAKQFTANLVWKKQVEVKPVTIDRYGRPVALVYYYFDGHKKCLNRELVAHGYAWVYRQYCTSSRCCKKWLHAEYEARQRKLGLWKDPNPVPPWVWRKKHRKSSSTFQNGHKKFFLRSKEILLFQNVEEK